MPPEPGQWIPIPSGNASDAIAPAEILTDVCYKYKQGERENYCLFFCVASMLFYCNYTKAAKRLKGVAEGYESLDGNQQINNLLGFL